MKSLKVLMVALVAILALGVAAGSAYATPNNTTTANSTAPFITPIGNTDDSSITGSGVESTFSTTDGAVTCPVTGSGYVPTTHTKANITDVQFGGPGPGTTCTDDIFGATISGVTDSVTSANPWSLHVTSVDGAGSSTGTVNITPVSLTFTLGIFGSCSLNVGAQSVDGTYTNANTSLVVNDATVAFTRTGSSLCPADGNATQTGTITFQPDTANDDLKVTAAS